MNICINCNNHYTGNYCNNCGQKKVKNRLSVRVLFHSFFHNIFNIEKGLWYTMYHLFVHPSDVILAYNNGNRIKYTNPLKFAFVVATLSTFLILTFDLMKENVNHINHMVGLDEQVIRIQTKVLTFTSNYLNIISLLTIPFYSIGSYFIYRRRSYNYAEHLVVFTYLSGLAGTMALIFIFTSLLSPYLSARYSLFSLFIHFLVYFYGVHNLFKGNIIHNLIKVIFIQITGLILFILSFVILMTFVMIIMNSI